MAEKYRVVALVSGGKDSTYSMVQCVAAGHEIVALANLRPADKSTDELDSYMYQTVGHQSIEHYSECMGLPLFRGEITGTSVDTGESYVPAARDEVEDLFRLLQRISAEVKFDAICSGAILSNYQRIRVENVCQRLGLVSLAFLWRREQGELLDEMIGSQIEAVVIKVATLGLEEKHVGKTIAHLRNHLHDMHEKYGINICGEGGEYETFTLDCPLFKKKLILQDSQIVIHSKDAFAPVAFLAMTKFTLQDKKLGDFQSQRELVESQGIQLKSPRDFVADILVEEKIEEKIEEENVEKKISPPFFQQPVFFKLMGEEWFTVSNISGRSENPVDATREAFQVLTDLLLSNGQSVSTNLVAVTLLVKSMTDFAAINREYVANFAANPPVRVCVEAPLNQVPLMLSAVGIQNQKKKDTMHVQSVSHWAPANIGPYSQAVKANGILYVAGQIGLIPGSMELADSTRDQARLSMRHLKRILNVYHLHVANIAQLVCYVSSSDYGLFVNQVWTQETLSESTVAKHCPPLSVVVMPELPKGAKVEWQAIASQSNNLELEDTKVRSTHENWISFIYASVDHKFITVHFKHTHKDFEAWWQQEEEVKRSKGVSLQVYCPAAQMEQVSDGVQKVVANKASCSFIPVLAILDSNTIVVNAVVYM